MLQLAFAVSGVGHVLAAMLNGAVAVTPLIVSCGSDGLLKLNVFVAAVFSGTPLNSKLDGFKLGNPRKRQRYLDDATTNLPSGAKSVPIPNAFTFVNPAVPNEVSVAPDGKSP